ncbi:hypothetical protein [Glycomyces sp. NPDC021274]|jgi:hypothetical protein|uniref:hypothetical protein n=1 Tax=Glycomyces sp. NPDC021274 TaxID=3155120 RepID=UPI0034039D75
MSMSAAGELPEEFRRDLAEQAKQTAEHPEPHFLAEEQPRLAEPASGWLLIGMLLVVAVGVLLLLIFASGGNAEQSLML